MKLMNYLLLLLVILIISCEQNPVREETESLSASNQKITKIINPNNPVAGENFNSSACPIYISSHSVTYYPDPLNPPKEFDADLVFKIFLGSYLPNQVTVQGQHKVGNGPWGPWINWSGQWTGPLQWVSTEPYYLYKCATDGHYYTTYYWRIKVKINNSSVSSNIYEFVLYYGEA